MWSGCLFGEFSIKTMGEEFLSPLGKEMKSNNGLYDFATSVLRNIP